MLAFAPIAWFNERSSSRVLRLDEHLTVALSRIAAGLQAGCGLDEVIETTSCSLPDGSPLTDELVKAARDFRTVDAKEAIRK